MSQLNQPEVPGVFSPSLHRKAGKLPGAVRGGAMLYAKGLVKPTNKESAKAPVK